MLDSGSGTVAPKFYCIYCCVDFATASTFEKHSTNYCKEKRKVCNHLMTTREGALCALCGKRLIETPFYPNDC